MNTPFLNIKKNQTHSTSTPDRSDEIELDPELRELMGEEEQFREAFSKPRRKKKKK